MTPETAHILAVALRTRQAAEDGLMTVAALDPELAATEPHRQTLAELADTYVHEQRVINRIIHDARDS